MTTGLLTPTHLMILLTVLLLLFGAKRLPEAGSSLGRSMREFKDAIAGGDSETTSGPAPNLTSPSDTSSTPTRGETS